jgi:hypothetical protein
MDRDKVSPKNNRIPAMSSTLKSPGSIKLFFISNSFYKKSTGEQTAGISDWIKPGEKKTPLKGGGLEGRA